MTIKNTTKVVKKTKRTRPKNFRGKGVKGKSGRKTARMETNYWKVLDAALPEAIGFCVEIMKQKQRELKLKKNKNLKAYELAKIQGVGLKAANIIVSKAPQRIADADGKPLNINFDNAFNTT